MAKQSEYSYEQGGYTILGDVRAGVVDSVGVAGGWNEISNYVSDLKYAVETGGTIEGWMLASGLSFRMADGTSTSPALAWGSPTWAEGIYRINTGSLGFSMDVLPSATGKDLGATGNRWDLFAQSIDVSATATFAASVLISGLTATRVPYASTAGVIVDTGAFRWASSYLSVGSAGAITGGLKLENAGVANVGILLPPAWAASIHVTLPDASGTLESQVNKNAVSGYAGLNASSRITKGANVASDYVVISTASYAFVMRDDAATTTHYWGLFVASAGTLSTVDLGTSIP